MKGTVKDASTGSPVQGAQIKVLNITGNRKIDHDITSGNQSLFTFRIARFLLNFVLRNEHVLCINFIFFNDSTVKFDM